MLDSLNNNFIKKNKPIISLTKKKFINYFILLSYNSLKHSINHILHIADHFQFIFHQLLFL